MSTQEKRIITPVDQLISNLRKLNVWRRGEDDTLEMPNPKDIGIWIEDACQHMENMKADVRRMNILSGNISLSIIDNDGDGFCPWTWMLSEHDLAVTGKGQNLRDATDDLTMQIDELMAEFQKEYEEKMKDIGLDCDR